MATYRTPGIYFEQRDAAPPAIGPVRTDVAGFMGIASRGPLHRPIRIETLTQFRNVFGGPIAQGYLAYAVTQFFGNGGATCWIVRVADPAKANEAQLNIVDEAGRQVMTIQAGSEGTWGNDIVARWVLRGNSIVSLTLHYPDGTEQLIRNPQQNMFGPPPPPAPPDGPNELDLQSDDLPADLVAPVAEVLPERPPQRSKPPTVVISAGVGQLGGGSDGLTTLTGQHFTGEDTPEGVRWGLTTLELVDEVAMVAIPDIMPKLRVSAKLKRPPPPDCRNLDAPIRPEPLPQTPPEFPPDLDPGPLQEALVRHCETMRYRVAILDTLDNLLPEAAIEAAGQFRTTTFAGLYYPWILVDDPLQLTGLVRSIPPSGGVAGIYARSDRLYGVHKPPANEVVQGALNVNVDIDDIIHGELNEAGVNAIRSFAGRGIRVYGARTTNLDLVWRYVNVRRLLCMIEKSIDRNSQWIVWEPNNAVLRREMDRAVRSFLEDLFRRGMLDGGDSSEAYLVKCDDATTPPEEQDLGRVICRIEVRPPYPAEVMVVVIGKTQNAMEILKEGGSIDG